MTKLMNDLNRRVRSLDRKYEISYWQSPGVYKYGWYSLTRKNGHFVVLNANNELELKLKIGFLKKVLAADITESYKTVTLRGIIDLFDYAFIKIWGDGFLEKATRVAGNQHKFLAVMLERIKEEKVILKQLNTMYKNDPAKVMALIEIMRKFYLKHQPAIDSVQCEV